MSRRCARGKGFLKTHCASWSPSGAASPASLSGGGSAVASSSPAASASTSSCSSAERAAANAPTPRSLGHALGSQDYFEIGRKPGSHRRLFDGVLLRQLLRSKQKWAPQKKYYKLIFLLCLRCTFIVHTKEKTVKTLLIFTLNSSALKANKV